MSIVLAATTINDIAKHMGDACYGFLTLNFLLGAVQRHHGLSPRSSK